MLFGECIEAGHGVEAGRPKLREWDYCSSLSLVFLLMSCGGRWDEQLDSGYVNIGRPDRISQGIGHGVWETSVRVTPKVWRACLGG